MKSTMQVIPLSVARILKYGAVAHRNTVVSTYFGDEADETTFGEIAIRAAAFANTLVEEFGIGIGDRVATFLSNCTEHLEALLSIASMGAVFNPINRFLMDDQITHIINHAEPRVIVVDPAYAERLVPLLDDCPSVAGLIVIGPKTAKVQAVEELTHDLTRHVRVLGYEASMDGRSCDYDWPILPETDPAAICYSTGTEGAPKGVVYSHRALWLHSLNLRTADSFGIRNGTPFLCCVPIYHVLSWGVPLAAFMSGAPMVFTGRTASPEHLAHVIASAMPRQAHGSPAVWTSLMVHYGEHPPKKMSLQEIYSGGSPVSPALIAAWEEQFGVDMIHCWGMTETGPVGTVAHPPAGVAGAARARYRDSQGRFQVGMEYRIVDDDGTVLEANDRNAGELHLRGNTVTGSYYHSPTQDGVFSSGDGDAADAHADAAVFRGEPVEDAASRFTPDGWLRTGDIATVNEDGYLTVHDRKADVIRSGGEWIYSAALENYLMEPQAVVEAAVIGIPDDKWGQRPLAVVQMHPGVPKDADTAQLMADMLAKKAPGWMVPEYWTFVDHIDKTSVDKFDKKDLREHFRRGDFDVFRL
ncbi:MAG TPA: long-chain fatty-acid--CoA ligase [Candidatus Corynebacterium gallistercoris]|uniref:Long-chain fatty-acid--CoA ligase n=1 Tax=Candidatus Corynebacterium gallistercoris TaxID=2838530 RepID=A0A9D1S1W7_9CORY|nr:long-chain fatty-acid--CoA ligase [Candidatus Corynebacterium gallistercoris]